MSPADPLSCVTSDASVLQTLYIAPQQTLVPPSDALPCPQHVNVTCRLFPIYQKRVVTLMYAADPLPCVTTYYRHVQTVSCMPQKSGDTDVRCRPFTLCLSRDLTWYNLYMVVHCERKENWHSQLPQHNSSALYSTLVEYIG